MRTVLDGQKRTRHQGILSNTAESINANGLEVLKVMDDESFREEEAALFDMKRAKTGE